MPNVVENQLIELERRYWQALKDDDDKTAAKLSDDPCIVAGPQGVATLDRQTLALMMKQGGWKLNSFEIDPDIKVKLLGDDVAVMAYKVRERLTVDGKPVELEAAETSTWVRRDGQWFCAMHAEAIAGDPFGRDRRASA